MMNARQKGIVTLSLSLALLGGLAMPSAQAQGMIDNEIGVSAATINQNSMLTITRLEPMANGGVCVTHDTAFKPDEVLTVDAQNRPVLMTVDASGNLVPHPTKRAGVHREDIIIVDKSVVLQDLQDNPMPTITYNESVAVDTVSPNGERTVSYYASDSTPITEADFNRPLPATSIETEVSFSCPAYALPAGWRAISVGGSEFFLDQNGVIQNVIP